MDGNIIGFASLGILIITNTFLVGRWVGKVNAKQDACQTHCRDTHTRVDERLENENAWRGKHQEHHEELARGQQK